MLAARWTFSGSPSISRLLSSRWVWTPNPASINRIFSSRVPKRLSTPRLMRTLDFIKWVLGTSMQGKIGDKGFRLPGKDSKLRLPAGAGCRTPSRFIIPRRVKPPFDREQGAGRSTRIPGTSPSPVLDWTRKSEINAMRRIVLCVLAALTSVVQASSQSAAFDSRPLSDSGLQNAIAFTRVLGYVQYFHPSDQAATMTWEAFTVAGMKQVEDAATPADLAGRMTTLFAPIAPSVLVFPTGPRPAIDPALHPADTTGLSVIHWDYLGFPSNPPSSSSPYSGMRISRPVIGGSIPAGFTDPASGFEADVGAGISCFVPVALYVDGHGTLPRPTVSQPVLPALPAFVDNRVLRLSLGADVLYGL